MRSPVDEQDLDALVVAVDADGPLPVRRLEVALPGIARLQDMPVGVDGQRLHCRVGCHGFPPVMGVSRR